MIFRTHGSSDIGCIRRKNEDAFIHDAGLGLFAVADGIGGLPGGKEASTHTIATLCKLLQEDPGISSEDLVVKTGMEIHKLGFTLNPFVGIGTTLTLIRHKPDGSWEAVHVGDSSLWLMRGGRLTKLTVDHNVENDLLARGMDPASYTNPEVNLQALTRCIGQGDPLVPDIIPLDPKAKDRYILSTDGITRLIPPGPFGAIVAAAEAPADCTQELIALANRLGGVDNSTAVALFFG